MPTPTLPTRQPDGSLIAANGERYIAACACVAAGVTVPTDYLGHACAPPRCATCGAFWRRDLVRSAPLQ